MRTANIIYKGNTADVSASPLIPKQFECLMSKVVSDCAQELQHYIPRHHHFPTAAIPSWNIVCQTIRRLHRSIIELQLAACPTDCYWMWKTRLHRPFPLPLNKKHHTHTHAVEPTHTNTLSFCEYSTILICLKKVINLFVGKNHCTACRVILDYMTGDEIQEALGINLRRSYRKPVL